MNFNAAVPMQIQPKFSEGSNLGISSRDDRNTSKLWKKCEVMVKNAEVVQRNLDKTIRAVSKLRLRRMGYMPGSGGFVWQSPNKECDPTLSVSKDTLVYCTTNNALVITGLVDRVSGTNQKACEGIWQAAQDVPAQGTDGKWNVPTFPYPGTTGNVTGAPGSQQGDLDKGQFWIYWGQTIICTT